MGRASDLMHDYRKEVEVLVWGSGFYYTTYVYCPCGGRIKEDVPRDWYRYYRCGKCGERFKASYQDQRTGEQFKALLERAAQRNIGPKRAAEILMGVAK